MSRTTRVRRTAEQWRSLITEQSRSGLSQQAFCKCKRLSLSTFRLWKGRLSASGEPTVTESEQQATWIDLGKLASARSGWNIELDLGDGVCLRLRRS
jgi:hypothetical protein